MRDCWVRDIADFAKFGLLKRLAGSDLRLGVFWYLTTHAQQNAPLVRYLSRPDEYGLCDRDLFDSLRGLHDARPDLTLADIEDGGVLPDSTAYYRVPLVTTALPRALRSSARSRWFSDGLDHTRDCDIVFLDPDTGLLPPTRRADNTGGEEYATIEEILTLCERGQTVVCVQFGRPQNLERDPTLARERLGVLDSALTSHGQRKPWGLWWRDSHKVGLFVCPSERHEALLHQRTAAILADRGWDGKVTRL